MTTEMYDVARKGGCFRIANAFKVDGEQQQGARGERCQRCMIVQEMLK